MFTNKGKRGYREVRYETADALVFGPETRAMPAQVLRSFRAGAQLRVPMIAAAAA